MTDDETDPEMAKAVAELKVMRRVLDVLKPLTQVERARVLATTAARFGYYDLARQLLNAAERLDKEPTP